MSATRQAVVAPRAPRPLAISVVSAVYGTLAVAAFAAAATMLVMLGWARMPPNLALGAGLLVAILILFALYAMVIATANLAGRRWAWSAAVLTSAVLSVLATLAILLSPLFLLRADWSYLPTVWDESDVQLGFLMLASGIVLIATLVPALRAYHGQPVRDYFGGV